MYRIRVRSHYRRVEGRRELVKSHLRALQEPIKIPNTKYFKERLEEGKMKAKEMNKLELWKTKTDIPLFYDPVFRQGAIAYFEGGK